MKVVLLVGCVLFVVALIVFLWRLAQTALMGPKEGRFWSEQGNFPQGEKDDKK